MTNETSRHDSLSELHEFVAIQAVEDAVLPADERQYQRDLVKDVLGQEALKPAVLKGLVSEYTQGVTSHLETDQIAA